MRKGKMEGAMMERLNGKRAYAPVLRKVRGKDVPVVVIVRYGERGYERILKRRFKGFDQAELAAERANRRIGLSRDDAWEIIENTVMTGC